ncbi:hypothetical protein GCM10010335_68430 [Streptomyces galbus]|nr:hypothetical protein GCM10010335_68430 [Streptomyces galbus]
MPRKTVSVSAKLTTLFCCGRITDLPAAATRSMSRVAAAGEVSAVRTTACVWDSAPVLPVVRAADAGCVGQRGMEIVMIVAQAFELQMEPVGKRITVRIVLPAQQPVGDPDRTRCRRDPRCRTYATNPQLPWPRITPGRSGPSCLGECHCEGTGVHRQ